MRKWSRRMQYVQVRERKGVLVWNVYRFPKTDYHNKRVTTTNIFQHVIEVYSC